RGEIRLEARRLGAPEHGQLAAQGQPGERLGAEQFAIGADERRRILGQAEQADAAWIADVVIEHGVEAPRLERADERLGIGTAAEDLKLHEEAAVDRLAPRAALADVRLEVLAACMPAHHPPRVCISRCGSRLRLPIWTSGVRCPSASRASAPRAV